MENDWQFSNHVCQTSSKSTQGTKMKHAKKFQSSIKPFLTQIVVFRFAQEKELGLLGISFHILRITDT